MSTWWVLDVDYRDDASVVAGVSFDDWSTPEGHAEALVIPGPPAEYEPGSFYLRELPCLLAFLKGRSFAGVVVDGFVWLGPDRRGLGAHLHTHIGRPVIGVAKTGFHGADQVAAPVLRGISRRPLWVTSAGVALEHAASRIRGMHGEFRIPTLLKQVDRACREHPSK